MWRAAIDRALAERSRLTRKQAIDEIARVLIEKAEEGDLSAISMLGDRLDGKPHQSSDVTVSGSLTDLLETIRHVERSAKD